MDVRCEKCGVEYSLDETLVGAGGTSVRCTKCGHVFKVFKPAGMAQAADTWLLRQEGGGTFPFERLGVLQSWIAEGKVHEDDHISKSGGPWKRLGDIAEMVPFFAEARAAATTAEQGSPVAAGFPRAGASEHAATIRASALGGPAFPPGGKNVPFAAPRTSPAGNAGTIGSVSAARGQPAGMKSFGTIPPPPMTPAARPSLTTPATAAIPPHPTRPDVRKPRSAPAPAVAPSEPDLSQVPAAAHDPKWERGRAVNVPGPAWAERKATTEDDDLDEDLAPPRRRFVRWVAIAIAAIAVGTAAYIVVFERPAAEKLFGGFLSAKEENRHETFYLKGRENFLLDTDASYRQADRDFQKVLALKENHVSTLAALAEMYAVWAQYLRDAEIDARTDAATAVADGQAPDIKEAERLRKEFDDRLADAGRWAAQAMEAGPDSPEAHRAMAEVKRLGGDLAAARNLVGKSRMMKIDPETDYVAALVDLDDGKPAEEVVATLGRVVKAEPLIRALYRQGRLLAALGRKDEALAALKKVGELNSGHERARALTDRITSGRPVAFSLSGVAEVKPPEAPAKADAGVAAPVVPAVAGEAPKPAATPPIATGGGADAMLAQAGKLQENGKVGEAMALFEKVLERSPSNIDALSGLAYCHLDKGSYGQAVTYFRRALGINPSYGPAVLGLAETFKAQGQKEQALKYYRQYLAQNPGGRQANIARTNIARLEEALGASGGAENKPSATPSVADDSKNDAPADVTVKRKTIEVPPPGTPTSDAPAVGTEPPGLPPITKE
ncbi:MAG: tetratricopeptide repeat protein [Deltaproteobacteria bacterium]|nr:tetratricopeptide repeat protein [Deltaproteobacteria bacterium]